MSASDRPSEYLKRTCLICGCNTNQTINIYEPRSGPNIVELIQAKFKFQPLNEDKYLCFSCNNWLINWHSLQANNSNDAESPSGTFRSSQVNGGVAQEKRAQSQLTQQKKSKCSPTYQETHQLQQWPMKAQQTTTVCRPVAHVRPRQISETAKPQDNTKAISQVELSSTLKLQMEYPVNPVQTAPKKRTKQVSYSKFCSRRTHRRHRTGKKHLSFCCVCGRSIVFYIRSSCGTLKQLNISNRSAKCRKCRSVCRWRSIYMRSLTKEHTSLTNTFQNRPFSATTMPQSLVSQENSKCESTESSQAASKDQSQGFKRPLVDGKVVAMLRRLGTTLSRDNSVFSAHQLPPIMSPTKPKPHWTRPLEADEVLLNFETAISEVLPIAERSCLRETKIPIRRKLTYQMSCETEIESDSTNEPNELKNVLTPPAYHDIFSSLPKGLEISLV